MAADPREVSAAEVRFHQEGLTGFRALAACWVMLFHLNGMVGPKVIAIHVASVEIELHPLMTMGWVGVILFFVLSGFLLTTHLLEALSRPNTEGVLVRYFAARVRRVFPAYWAQLALLLAGSLWLRHAMPDWAHFLPLHAFMLHNFTEASSFAINPVYWTLPIEFGFYLCLPAVAQLLRRAEQRGAGKWRTLVTLYAGTLAVVWAYRYGAYQLFAASPVNTIVWATSQLPGTFDQFIAGSAAAVALRWWRRDRAAGYARRPLASTAFGAVGLAALLGLMYFLDSIYEIYWAGHWAIFVWHSAVAFSVALLVVGIALGGPFTRALFENRLAVFLGTVSYSIYLWHFPVGLWIMQRLDMAHMGTARFMLYTVPAIVAVSALSYYLVERPFLRRGSATPR